MSVTNRNSLLSYLLMGLLILTTFGCDDKAELLSGKTSASKLQREDGGDRDAALAACFDLYVEDSCAFIDQNSITVEGICAEVEIDIIACIPDMLARAVEACDGSSEGESCSFDGPDGTISDNCHVTPEEFLACGRPPQE